MKLKFLISQLNWGSESEYKLPSLKNFLAAKWGGVIDIFFDFFVLVIPLVAREYEGYSTSEGSYSTSVEDIPRGRSAEHEGAVTSAARPAPECGARRPSGISTERVE